MLTEALLYQVKLQSQAKALPGQKPQFSGAFDATRQVKLLGHLHRHAMLLYMVVWKDRCMHAA